MQIRLGFVASLTLLCAMTCAAVDIDVGQQIAAGTEVEKEIKDWKPGQEVPHRLLSWPAGNVAPRAGGMLCGLEEYGFSVRPRIHAIENEKLLEEIVFDPRAESLSLQAAVVRLVDLKGLPWFANMIAKRDSTRWELDVFRQMLQSPFARASVAFIAKDVMSQDEARRALEEIRSKLDKGETWLAAYSTVADAHPDVERRKREPGSVGVLITYLYSGWGSAHGFDFSSMQLNPNVPAPYLADAIRAGKGGKITAAPDGLYLVYVFQMYSPQVQPARAIAAR